MLRGPRVQLVPVGPEHHERLDELRRTPEVLRWWQDPADDWLAEDDDVERFAVLLRGAVVGYVQWWQDTDPKYRHAGVDLFVEPAGAGIGTEALQVMCAHLVDEHGFHRLVIDPELANERAIASFRKAGFKPVGVLRRSFRHDDGEWVDGLLMDLLADELVRPQARP
jgi:aminoglycoside 6'-N-acetyltransferase